MLIQVYECLTNSHSRHALDLDLEGLAAFLRRYPHEGAKGDAPLWAPQEFHPGAPGVRKAENVARLHAVVLDLDDLSGLDWQRVVLPALRGREYVAHTSYSHWRAVAQGDVRLRVVLSVSRPVEASEWPDVRERVRALLGVPNKDGKRGTGGADRVASTLATAFYLWSWPPGGQASAWLHYERGAPLDVDTLLSTDRRELARPRAIVANLRTLAARMTRSRSAERKRLGDALGQLASGLPFAGEGERNQTAFVLAGILAREFQGASEAELREVFRQSIDAGLHEPGAVTHEQVADMVSRQCADRASVEHEADALRERWRECLLRSGRDEAYSEEELDEIAERSGLDRDGLRHAWVLQYGQGYYLRGERGYLGPYQAAELPERAEVVLAPADTDGVSCQELRAGRVARRKPSDLVAAHGRVLDSVVYSLSRQESAVVERDGRSVLYLAACPLRAVEGRHVPEVDAWLRLLGGSSADFLLDWIATITSLDEPAQALFLEGQPGAGKSLLAAGLARLWNVAGPTSIDDALGRFNDRLLRCPLVFGDERIPCERGMPRVDDLKREISDRSRRLEAKYQKVADMEGAVRFLLAANNREMLLLGADLTSHDVEALVARLIHVQVGREAADYLVAIDRDTLARWVEGDEIAAHALWLRDNRQVERGRFAVKSAPNDGLRSLTTDSGLRAAICHWLVLWLTTESPATTGFIRCRGGQLWVSARGLQLEWEKFPEVGTGRVPSLNRISEALVPLSRGREREKVGRSTTLFEVVDLGALCSWAERKGFATADEVRERVLEKSQVR